jgi:hypothetical protein
MKLLFRAIILLILAMIIIPTGGMCESNPYHKEYMYSFLTIEILVLGSIIRVLIINRNK